MLSRFDFSPLFMHCYEFLLNIRVGLPNNSIISSNMVDLKNIYYAEIDELGGYSRALRGKPYYDLKA